MQQATSTREAQREERDSERVQQAEAGKKYSFSLKSPFYRRLLLVISLEEDVASWVQLQQTRPEHQTQNLTAK